MLFISEHTEKHKIANTKIQKRLDWSQRLFCLGCRQVWHVV